MNRFTRSCVAVVLGAVVLGALPVVIPTPASAAFPSLTSLAPGTVSRCGGEIVTITGKSLQDVDTVALGPTPERLAYGTVVESTATEVRAIMPRRPRGAETKLWLGVGSARVDGSLNIVVTDADTCSGKPPVVVPAIWTVSTTTLNACGGTKIVIKGSGLNFAKYVGFARSNTETWNATVVSKKEGRIVMRSPRITTTGSMIVFVMNSKFVASTRPVTITACP